MADKYHSCDDTELSLLVESGDKSALNSLLFRNRARLKNMVMLRISSDLQRRIDGSDIIQEAFLQAALSISEYVHDPACPFYFWIRKITQNKLQDAQRKHLTAKKRSVTHEEILPASGSVNSATLANHFVTSSKSGPLNAAVRAEVQSIVQEELQSLEETDREVLVLRHYEQLSLAEIANLLGLSKSGVAKRYRMAIERMRAALDSYPFLF